MARPGACRLDGLILPHAAIGSNALDRSVEISDDSDSDGSANEYAEGLGCADRKACTRRPDGVFEFDEHPREEYFEQPRSHESAVVSDDDAYFLSFAAPPPTKRARGSEAEDDTGTNLRGVLARLEWEEVQAVTEHNRAERVQRQLAKVARRCAQRSAARAMATERTSAADSSLGSPKIDLVAICAKLSCSRVGKMSDPGLQNRETAAMLEKLSNMRVTADSLAASGLSRELNLTFWQRHTCPDIARRSMALVNTWKEVERPELRRDRSRDGGA